MARGDKDTYSDKQKRTAAHIEESYEKKGVPEQEAEKRAWATINKQSGGGEAGGSGQKKPLVAKKSARENSAKRAVATKQGIPRDESEKLETKASLQKKAREKNISGRSSMNKSELLEALKNS